MGSFLLIPILFFGLIILFSSFFTVKQQTAVIIERFGKFNSVRTSGLGMKIPLVDRIVARVGLKNSTIGRNCRDQNLGRCLCKT